jgi:DNA-binding response OmpR family regulator
MAKILLVEGDAASRFAVQACLSKNNHTVDHVSNCSDAIGALTVRKFDLIILDWNLPDGSGLDVCKRYRDRGGHAPILMLSARTGDDLVVGLDNGIDDFMSKPFEPRILLAKIRALLRRPELAMDQTKSVGGLKLDPTSLEIRINDGPGIKISPQECLLLELLMKHPDKAIPTERLIEKIWSTTESLGSSSGVRTIIKKLRRKLNDTEGQLIRNERFAGYKFCTKGIVVK